MSRATVRRVAVAAVILVLAAGIGYAAVSTFILTDGTHLNASDGPEIELGENADLNAHPHPFPNDQTINLSPYGTVSSSGPTSLTATQFTDAGSQTILETIELNGASLTASLTDREQVVLDGNITRLAYREIAIDGDDDIELNADGDWTLTINTVDPNTPVVALDADDNMIAQNESELDGSLVLDGSAGSYSLSLVEAADPEYDEATAEPSETVTIEEDPVTLGVNVSHANDLDINATFNVNGDEVGTDSVTGGNGRVETTVPVSQLDGGENEWSVELEDSLGGTTTMERTLVVPNELVIRDEITTEILDSEGDEITVRFFETDSEEIVTRTTTDGTVDMSGLDVSERFITTIDIEGYYDRRVLIESLLEQQNAFVLNESEDAIFNEFTLTDETGQFPPSESLLIIQKPIELGSENSSRYRTIAGDEFGADQQVPMDLLRGERYRLLLENEEGDRRSLGSYTGEAEGLVNLEIGSVSWPPPDEQSYAVELNEIEEGNTTTLEVLFNNPDGIVDEFTFTIESRFDSDEVIYEETVTDPSEYQALVPLTDEQRGEQWALNYTVEIDGSTSDGFLIAGGEVDFALPVGPWWMQAFSMVLLTVIAAMFPGPMVRIGGAALVGFAGILILLGWLQIPVMAWFVALIIAAAGIVRGRHQGGYY